jgi:PAS domain S-box-containing protein
MLQSVKLTESSKPQLQGPRKKNSQDLFDDMTENKRLENGLSHTGCNVHELTKGRSAKLVESNKVLREQATLLELVHDAIIVRDLDAKVKYWNKAAEKLYGWHRREAKGKIIHELLRTRFPVPLQEIESVVLDKGEWQGELIHMTRQNTPVVVESRWALQRDQKENPVAMLETNRDITARKIAESAAKDYFSKLEKSNQELRDFASMASHDLQEPLRKLSIFGGILETEFGDALGKQGQAYLGKMLNATARMQKLIESLLMYSRVTTRSEPFVSVDLGELVEEVLLDLEIPIQETGAKVETGALPRIQADPGQIRQLFQNLIGNALKFHSDNPHIKVYSQTCREGTCKIFIEDDGIGFEEKHLDKIFQPFQSLHGKSSPYKGSGMGLAICMKIIDRHNGAITARSAPGKGSTFIVTLPLKQCDENEACAA